MLTISKKTEVYVDGLGLLSTPFIMASSDISGFKLKVTEFPGYGATIFKSITQKRITGYKGKYIFDVKEYTKKVPVQSGDYFQSGIFGYYINGETLPVQDNTYVGSSGLRNDGVEHFCNNYLEQTLQTKGNIIISIAGTKLQNFFDTAKKIKGHIDRVTENKTPVKFGVEINLQCPTTSPKEVSFDRDSVRTYFECFKKIFGNAPLLSIKVGYDIEKNLDIVRGAVDGGATAVSAINMLKPIPPNFMKVCDMFHTQQKKRAGGFTGRMIFPYAVRAVAAVRKTINELNTNRPVYIIGTGGLGFGSKEHNIEDIITMTKVGADLFGICSRNITDKNVAKNLQVGLLNYMHENKLKDMNEFYRFVRE